MTGKSLRKALRKFFRLRKSNSESRLNYDGANNPAGNVVAGVATLGDTHRSVDRTQSHDVGRDLLDAEILPELTIPRPDTHLQTSLRLAHQSSWYWGPIEPTTAEAILEKEKDGTFLVRDSSDRTYVFSLSCKYDGKVGHIRIEKGPNYFMFRKIEHYKCENIREFIEQAMLHSQTGSMTFMTRPRPGVDATKILLLYPLDRQKSVPSLQHLARFAILEATNRKDIAVLPIPLPLKKYLNQKQYFVELDRRARPS